jgi:hypothetical protein
MEILNLGGSNDSSGPAPKKKFKVLLGVGLLAAVMGMGSTLAASITLSSGSPVEFGQGVAATTACDSSLTVTPFSTYVNRETSTAADFLFSSVTISNLDTRTTNTSTGEGCGGRVLVLKAYAETSTAASKYADGQSVANPLFLGWNYASSGFVTGGVTQTPTAGVGFNTGISIGIPTSGSNCTILAGGPAGKMDLNGVTCTITPGAADAASVRIVFGKSTGSLTTGAAYGVPSSAVAKVTLESSASAPADFTSETV